jgi:hypothetical protein
VLQQHAQVPANGSPVTAGVVPQDPHAPTRRRGQPFQDLQRGGLAGPVDAQQREHLAGVDLEGDPADGVEVAVPALQADHLDGGSRGRRGLPWPWVDVDSVHDGLPGECASTRRCRAGSL